MFRDKSGNSLTYIQSIGKIKKRFINYLIDFELLILRWAGHIPFHSIRKIIYRTSGLKIGKGSVVHLWCNFFNPKGIEIGNDTIIGDHAFLDGRAPLIIGNHVCISSQVLIYNSEHNINSPEFKAIEEPVTINDYVYIGARVTILPGVTIGRGAVVASHAVVTKDVPEMVVVAGVPATIISKRNISQLNYILGRARLFQ